MAGASYGVLGLLGGAVLYGTARKRLSASWLMTIVVVGALSGLLLGRAATLPWSEHIQIVQRGALAVVFTAWWFLIREVIVSRRDDAD